MFAARLLGGLLGLGLLAVGGLVAGGALVGAPLAVLFRDAGASATSAHAGDVYVGAGSTLAIVAWGAVSALSAFVAWVVRDGRLLLLAALTAVMCADDALQLHETVAPRLGVPEGLLPVAYGVGGLVLLQLCRRAGWAGSGWALLTGGALLGLSVGVDAVDQLVLHGADGWAVVLEDGAELLGAMAWLAVPVLVHAERAPAAAPAVARGGAHVAPRSAPPRPAARRAAAHR